jgi:hypothetical protein
MPFTKANAAVLGRRSDLATSQRYDRAHLQTIGRRGFRATTGVLERPGRGEWLLGKLYPQQYRKGATQRCLICERTDIAYTDPQAWVAFCAHHAPLRNPRRS